LLTDQQLRFECRRVLKRSDGSRAELLEGLRDAKNSSLKLTGDTELNFRDGNKQNMKLRTSGMKFELSATHSMVGADGHCIFAPACGPAFVPIHVKRIPLLAAISSHSFFTVIPSPIVTTFQLKTKPISSSRFITYHGETVETIAVVDEFKFTLGSVEICLNNALVPKHSSIGNIQLGMDFLESAAWARLSTPLAFEASDLGAINVVTDGGYTGDLFLAKQPDELRYYSRDGKIAAVPFVHIQNLSGSAHLPVVTLPQEIVFTAFPECQWCCRCFPSDGMLCHNGRFYCDDECLDNGLKVRPD
jgi:hypothetical protein